MKFRTLEASEIDARIGTISEKGLSLLLYKDARADMIILDETVGCLNWKREHTRENANCIVSIWDAEKGQWVSKEDTGAESFTEKEKGLASDSFKRACVNWGIGRELYTAPFIWIKATDYEAKEKNGKFSTFDKFVVTQISYDSKRNIVSLEVKNSKTNKIVYKYGLNTPQQPPRSENTSSQVNTPPPEKTPPQPVKKHSKALLNKLYAIANSKGYSIEDVKKLAIYKYKVADITEITAEQLNEMILGYEGCKVKEGK